MNNVMLEVYLKRFCFGPPGCMSDMRHMLEIRSGNQCEFLYIRSMLLIDLMRSLQRPNDVSLSTAEMQIEKAKKKNINK